MIKYYITISETESDPLYGRAIRPYFVRMTRFGVRWCYGYIDESAPISAATFLTKDAAEAMIRNIRHLDQYIDEFGGLLTILEEE